MTSGYAYGDIVNHLFGPAAGQPVLYAVVAMGAVFTSAARAPQALFASESLGQALRQLEVYGRDGLPVISPDGQRVEGWVTGDSVLRALARQVTGSQAAATRAQAAADWGTAAPRPPSSIRPPQDSPPGHPDDTSRAHGDNGHTAGHEASGGSGGA